MFTLAQQAFLLLIMIDQMICITFWILKTTANCDCNSDTGCAIDIRAGAIFVKMVANSQAPVRGCVLHDAQLSVGRRSCVEGYPCFTPLLTRR